MTQKFLSHIKYTALSLLIIFAYSAAHAVINATDITVDVRVSGSDLIADRDGDGLDSSIVANTAPTISLTGASTVTYTEGDTYSELGATCTDTEDGSITVPAPTFSPTLNMSAAGSYVAAYTCTDSGSLTDTATRTINVNSAGSALAFTDVTTTVIDTAPQVVFHFWAGFPDVNGDGCIDAFLGSHYESEPSEMYIHDNVDGVCQGTFTNFPNVDNYSQATPTNPRVTSRYMWGNWYEHPLGFWSYYGHDVDVDNSSRYTIDPAFTTVGGEPSYLPKTNGCWHSQGKCIPMDINGDGDFEFAYRSYVAPYDAGTVIDMYTGAELYPADGPSTSFTESLIVFDVDNDGVPEVVSDAHGGYFEFNSGDSSMDWQASKITGTLVNVTGNHKLPLDYDNDGDLDLYVGEGAYDGGGTAGPFYPHLYENDGSGNFTDVTSTAFASATLYNRDYWTTYGNSIAGDVDLDGDIDILFGAENITANVTFLINNGNGTFSVVRDECSGDGTNDGSGRPWVNLADYDNDGLLDVVRTGGPNTTTHRSINICRNTTSTSNHYLRVRARGAGNNTDGLHTRLSFFEPGTTNLITYYEVGAFGLGSQSLITNAGLGANAVVDVRAEFPHGGATCNFSNVSADQDIIVYSTCNYESYTPGSAIPLTYVASNDVNTTVTLVADSAITPTSTELVTFGLPFAEGAVTDISELKVSIGGSEVAAYAEPTLTHHWSDNSIRAATIQIQNVDMTGGNVTVTITDEGASVSRLTETAHSTGWTAAGADKNSLSYPRIFALHDPQYLADSGITSPYTPAPAVDDAFQTFVDDQFDNWAVNLDYSTSTRANWLFDRPSATFKHYMTSGDVKFLKEAFLAKQFYFSHVETDGDWAYGGGNCAGNGDGKYIYTQPAKLALALVGDDSQWDNTLINNMALSGAIQCQPITTDAHDAEDEAFTERAAGIAGLAEINAYEITASATVLSEMNARITSLKGMQQDIQAWDTANSWTPKSGAFTHSISQHEGDAYPGDGTSTDRGFSPWMSENIADFLWQAYWITGNTDIPDMLKNLASAVDQYGFSTQWNGSSYDYRTGFSGSRTRSCNTTGAETDILYFGSAYAGDSHLATNHWAYYTDEHNIDVVLILAAGYHFETDTATRTRLKARIDRLHQGWSNCASVTNNPRQYNWNHRGNSVRTWEYINGGTLS